MKIIFDNALRLSVDEVYVTIFGNRTDQHRLILLLQDRGFRRHGTKNTESGEEIVLVRDFTPQANIQAPRLTFPYMSVQRRKFIVAIYPDYHTELLPDPILRTESPEDFIDNRPNRNALRKAYISRSIRRDIAPGDIVVFYRTAAPGRSATIRRSRPPLALSSESPRVFVTSMNSCVCAGNGVSLPTGIEAALGSQPVLTPFCGEFSIPTPCLRDQILPP